MREAVGKLFASIGIGIAIGLLILGMSLPIRFIKNREYRKEVYYLYFLSVAIVVSILSDYLSWPDSKYIGLLIGSYLVSIHNE